MGSCTSKKVQNSVIPGAITKKQINEAAHEHLKNMLNEDPMMGTMTSAALNSTLKKLQKQNKEGDEARVVDKDGANFEEDGGRMHEPLWQAIETNDIASATKFLNLNDIEEQNMYDANGMSMLHKTAQLGLADMLMLLMERTGAKPDLVNAQLATPLHVACRSNKENVVKFLIGCGVEANTQDEHGQTPLLVCCIHGFAPLVSLLIESSIAGHLPEPIEIDTGDHRGLTPLNCAAIKGDFELVKILISRGQADVNQTSPKGCTPLIYAGRGGYSEVVRYLLEKKASPLKQDNAGGTVLHHCIEKGHLSVLEVLLEHGVDVYSAIELADNAGRTPLFEAVEMELEDQQSNDQDTTDDDKMGNLIRILTKPKRKQDGGFGAKVNVINYNGQTPLFSAVKSGNFGAIKTLVEMGASVDLHNGELVKEEEQSDAKDEDFDSIPEKCFMEAFMNCMTPLHVAATLGYDEIALYLIQHGADVDLQSNFKKYSALHMAVLSNKPEMLIELLTKTNANYLLEDGQGRTLLDLIYAYNPSYVESFQSLLENLQMHRIKSAAEREGKPAIARHFVNAADERAIQGAAESEIAVMYEAGEETKVPDGGLLRDPSNQLLKKGFDQVEEQDIAIDEEGVIHPRVEVCFGRKVAIGLIAADWKLKEMAIKHMTKRLEKLLGKADTNASLAEVVEACTAAVGQTCREKVMKVFNVSLHMFNLIISSSKIDQDFASIAIFHQMIVQEEIIQKLLLKSEESNTRLTNKIHEALLDLSYHPKIGEDIVSQAILERIEQHYACKPTNQKGLLAQLAILFKMINSFGIEIPSQTTDGSVNPSSNQVLSVPSVLKAAVPSIALANQDIKNAATKIILDVQRLTGQVKEHHLLLLPEKTRDAIKEKVFSVQCETDLNQTRKRDSFNTASKGGDALAQMLAAGTELSTVKLSEEGFTRVEQDIEMAKETFGKNKAIILDKGQHKDWQLREIALSAMQESFEAAPAKVIKENQDFLPTCVEILKNCLEDNNIQIYLVGIQTASVFLQKTLSYEPVMESLPSIIKLIMLKTTDTNTRVRKKSIDLVNQIWDSNAIPSAGYTLKAGTKQRDHDSISIMIAQVLCDSQLHDKSIVGRLSLFIKKAMMIESGDELNKRAFKMILGKDYEQLTEFACQWCMHKNTKVRQCALKLIIEICRLNYIDPRGQPFKQRIINFILGLRPSLRDPLVTKINEVCSQEQVGQAESKEDVKTAGEPYINVNEMELNLATKGRAASMDVRRGREQARQQQNKQGTGNLPQIGVQDTTSLPGLSQAIFGGTGGQLPAIVLPHSEPLNEAQRAQAEPFLEVFGQELMTCFYSSTWSTRAVAIQKIEEQLHNLDPRRRDAMYGEINRSNLPPELTIKVFLQLINEGFKDPNLKNYLSLLELVQKALPCYFRYLQPNQIKAELIPLVKNTLAKTSDLKAKVREASINFCLYLSHQSPIGPEVMINQVTEELTRALKPQTSEQVTAQISSSATSSFGNSHLIASCLQLMNSFQSQTKLLESTETYLCKKYVECIDAALKHTNPTVRKQAEDLFKTLYLDFGEIMLQKLAGQKPQLVQKLTHECKAEKATSLSAAVGQADPANITSSQFGQRTDSKTADQQRTLMQLSENFVNMPQIKNLVDGKDELLKELRMPNPQKRLKAIIDIKKIIQKKLAKISSVSAREMIEPMQTLLRELLRDDNTDVYLEALNLLKFIVGSLASHMSALDLHLMMGQFISLTVTNASNANMRIRVASDKVIIFFAKHQNIGSFIVAKEVIKNVERTNWAIQSATQTIMSAEDTLAEQSQKKDILARHYYILHMLLQQFSIVLCYQPEFYVKCLEHIAETINASAPDDQPAIKSICSQIIITLYDIDAQLLDQGVNKLDFKKKTPIRKIMIEHENLIQKHKDLKVVTNNEIFSHKGPTYGPNFIANAGDRDKSPEQSLRDTQQSFASFGRSNQGEPESPANSIRLRKNDDFGQTDTGQSWNRQSSEVRSSRRGNVDLNPTSANRFDSMNNTGKSWLNKQTPRASQQESGSIYLPDISSHKRRPPMGESFQSMGRMTGAAGFKRDTLNSGGNGPPNAGLTGFSFKDPSSTPKMASGNTQTSSFGLNQPTEDQMSSTGIGSARRSFNQRVAAGMVASGVLPTHEITSSITSIEKDSNRPPIYVPTRREPAQGRVGLRDSLNGGVPLKDQAGSGTGYQPKTQFSYVPSAEVAQQQKQKSIFGQQNSRGSSGSRYQPSQSAQQESNYAIDNQQQSIPMGMGKGVQRMLSRESMDLTIASPQISKPPIIPVKPKPIVAPPVATFQIKTNEYKGPKNSEKRPDMMM